MTNSCLKFGNLMGFVWSKYWFDYKMNLGLILDFGTWKSDFYGVFMKSLKLEILYKCSNYVLIIFLYYSLTKLIKGHLYDDFRVSNDV